MPLAAGAAGVAGFAASAGFAAGVAVGALGGGAGALGGAIGFDDAGAGAASGAVVAVAGFADGGTLLRCVTGLALSAGFASSIGATRATLFSGAVGLTTAGLIAAGLAGAAGAALSTAVAAAIAVADAATFVGAAGCSRAMDLMATGRGGLAAFGATGAGQVSGVANVTATGSGRARDLAGAEGAAGIADVSVRAVLVRVTVSADAADFARASALAFAGSGGFASTMDACPAPFTPDFSFRRAFSLEGNLDGAIGAGCSSPVRG